MVVYATIVSTILNIRGSYKYFLEFFLRVLIKTISFALLCLLHWSKLLFLQWLLEKLSLAFLNYKKGYDMVPH